MPSEELQVTSYELQVTSDNNINMTTKRLFLILFCFAFSLNLMANEVIQLTWRAVPIYQGYIYSKYITIIATENKTFTIDWGDGSNVETKTGTGVNQILNHTYSDAKSYTATITGSSTDCLFTYLDCNYHGVTNLNMGASISLKTLHCSRNWLHDLDVSHCPALEYLDCSENSLTKLNISTNTALKHLDCHFNDSWVNLQGYGNGISYLDFSNCELTYLDCSYNSFPLSNLYVASEMIGEIENKIFDHQTLPRKKIITDTPVDFSSEIEFGGITTFFDVIRDCDNIPAIEGVDYTINEGIITFLKHNLCNSGFIVTMTNETIPATSVTTSFYTYDFMHVLSELTVSEGTLDPEFNSITFNYIVNVGEDISEITLSAIPNNPNTIISGTGAKVLSLGENNFIVNALTWFSKDEGTSLDYKIKVIRGILCIDDTCQSSKVKIYPNPTNYFVEIDFGNNFRQYQALYIYDLMGKLFLTVAVTQEKQQINIQHLPAGAYIVQIVSKGKGKEKGKLNVSKKLLITR